MEKGEKETTDRSVSFLLRSTTKADIDEQTKPCWLSISSFIYLSGCNIVKYDLTGPQCTILPREPEQASIKLLRVDQVIRDNESDSFIICIYEDTAGQATLMVRSAETPGQKMTIKNSHFKSAHIFSNNSKVLYIGIVSQDQGRTLLSIYNMHRGVMLTRQEWKDPIKYLLPYQSDGLFFTVCKHIVRCHSFSSINIETSSESIVLPSEQVLCAEVVMSECLVFAFSQQIVTAKYRNGQFSQQKLQLSCDILENDEIQATTIKDCFVFYALSGQRLLVIQLNIDDVTYSSKYWIATGLTSMKILSLNVSMLCQNVLIFSQKDTVQHKRLYSFPFDMFSLSRLNTIRPQRLPMTCQPSKCIGIAVSYAKEDALRLTDREVHIGEHLQVPLDQPTCFDVDPYGIFLTIGFEFYFNVFAIRNSGLTMIHSVPMLSCRKIAYVIRYPNTIVMFKTEFRVYDSYSWKELWDDQTANSASEYVSFEVDQRNCLMLTIETCGLVSIYDIMARQKIQTFYLNFRLKFFDCSWHDDSLIYVRNKKTIYKLSFKNNTEIIVARSDDDIKCIKYCQELKILLVGSSTGKVTAYSSERSTSIRLFEAAITCLQLSTDRSMLFVSAEDGNFAKIQLTYHQDEAICKGTLINILRQEGIGFSTYYLSNFSLETVSKQSANSHNEIQDLQMENQRKNIHHEQEVENINKKIMEQSIECNKKLKKQRAGMLIKQRDVLRNSKRQFKKLEKTLRQWLPKDNRQKSEPDYYLKLIKNNEHLEAQLSEVKDKLHSEKLQKEQQYEGEMQRILTENALRIQEYESNVASFLTQYDRQLNNDREIFSLPPSSPYEEKLKQLNEELLHLNNSNDELRISIRNLKEEKVKFDSKRMEYNDLFPELQDDLDRLQTNNQEKVTIVKDLSRDHKVLEGQLSRQANIEKICERGSKQFSNRIDEMLANVRQLQSVTLVKVAVAVREVNQEFDRVRQYLTNEVAAKNKYTVVMEQLSQQRIELKRILATKKYELHQSLCKFKHFQLNIQQAIDSLEQRSRHSRHNTATEMVGGVDKSAISKGQRIVQNLCHREHLCSLRTQQYRKQQNTTIKIHMKENERLLGDINEMKMERHEWQCHLREKANLLRKVEQSLHGMNINLSSSMQTRKDNTTPFQRYHMNKLPKFRNRKVSDGRSSRSTNCSFFDRSRA